MTYPQAVADWCQQHGHGDIVSSDAVGGGCINNGQRIKTTSGRTFFLKRNSQAPMDMFAREAEGLAALAAAGGPRVPRVFTYGSEFLLMEDLAPAPPASDYWERLGTGLARLHDLISPTFGFEHDNYLGRTPQPNPLTQDGFDFFRSARLGHQAALAVDNGLLSHADAARVGQLAGRLESLIPEQPASLLHGDLWSGNAIADSDGSPALIDPAAHFGWPEADLAMSALFGGFPGAFYDAYVSARPLPPGWRSRFPIYNLYHLLNHLNLFGPSYLRPVQSVLSQFGD